MVALDSDGGIHFQFGGLLPYDWGFKGSVFESELFGALCVCESTVGHLRMWIDNAAVVAGFQRSSQNMLQDRSMYQLLWRRIGESLGGRTFDVRK
eukprot:4551374-Amphidinium_carterae.1